jgi:hypothetical protein
MRHILFRGLAPGLFLCGKKEGFRLIGDAEARGLTPATLQKLRHIFAAQLLDFAEQQGITFLRDFNSRNLTEWRRIWKDKELARKKKFERVVGICA